MRVQGVGINVKLMGFRFRFWWMCLGFDSRVQVAESLGFKVLICNVQGLGFRLNGWRFRNKEQSSWFMAKMLV